mgnify:CR=1 FL=1
MDPASTLIVATWGNPGGWHSAKYSVEVDIDKTNVGSEKEVGIVPVEQNFKSTLGALQSVFDGHSLILASNTLASFEKVEEASFECVLRAAERYMRSKLDQGYLNTSKSFELLILPGTGRFMKNGNGYFETMGTPLLYMLCAFREVAKRIMNRSVSRVVLDISHGVNYMPLMAYRSVVAAIHYYSLLKDSSIELLVYNSDPITPDGGEAVIHLVERTKVEPSRALEHAYESSKRLNEKELSKLFIKPPSAYREKAKLANKLKEARNELVYKLETTKEYIQRAKGFVNGARKGLPLYLMYQLAELAKLDPPNPLSPLEGLETKSIVEFEGNNIRVIYLANPSEEALDLIFTIALLHRLIKDGENLTRSSFTLDSLRSVIDNYIVERFSSTIARHEMDDIENRIEASKAIFEKFNLSLTEAPYQLVYELCEAKAGEEKVIEAYRENPERFTDWLHNHFDELKPQAEKLLREHQDYKCEGSKIDKRNFYAHAGLERHAVRVNLREKTLEYYPECLETVRKYANED